MRRGALLLAALGAACAPEPGEESGVHVTGACDAPSLWAELPADVMETSGVAASRAYPGIFWTHNDSEGDSAIFALDSTGTIVGRVRVREATNRDWEDIAVAPCSPGSADQCLFVGDIGDNRERREHVVVFIVPEPHPREDTVSRPAVRLQASYPGGGRDAEALFVTDRGVHIITKGRTQSIELYRIPPPFTAASPRILERVQELAPPPTSVSAQVTAAATSPDGRTVVIRTYSGLRFFDATADTLRPLGHSDFSNPAQPLGEGVDFLPDGRLVLTGEASGRVPATISVIRCDLPTEPPAPL